MYTIDEISKEYKIPASTLKSRSRKEKLGTIKGNVTIFTEDEKSLLIDSSRYKRGKPRNEIDIRGQIILPTVLHKGILKIGNLELPVVNLSDGTRGMSKSAINAAFKRKKGGWYKNRERKLINYIREIYPECSLQKLPNFMDSKALLKNASKEFIDLLEPVICKDGNILKEVYKAEMLPKLCSLYLEARRSGDLDSQQSHLADQAEILLQSFAAIGLAALVDEATGYIKVKKEHEYRELFKQFLATEAREYSSKFPKEFYDMVWKFWGKGINSQKTKRPPAFSSQIIRKYVYKPLCVKKLNLPEEAEGILLFELEEKNPVDIEKGKRKYYFHQFLNEIGGAALEKHLQKMILLGEISDNKGEFEENFKKVFKINSTLKVANKNSKSKQQLQPSFL